MDRFPHETPCSASIAELAHDRGVEEYSPRDLKDAREELLEKLLEGKSIGFPKFGFDALLEQELNDSYASTLSTLSGFFLGIDQLDECGRIDRLAEMQDFAKRLCNACLERHEELVQERAGEIAADALENAS